MKKMLFIVNPTAGTKKAAKFLAQIIGIFNGAGYEVVTYMTAAQGDCRKITAQRAKDMDVAVFCGGDGTFNEGLAGLTDSGVDIPVGYIPAGSTNDFASSLGLSTNLLQAAQDIVDGEAVSYDVGSFGGRVFSYVASFGAFTRASYDTPQSLKNVLGHTAYVLQGITEFTQLRTEHVKLELDEQVIEGDFLFGAISNSTSVGGILTLTPKLVDMRDGKFEILLVRKPRNLTEITECLTALQKQTYNCAMMSFLSASHVRVTASPEMPWTLDGEREPGHEVVDVECRNHAYRLLQRRTET